MSVRRTLLWCAAAGVASCGTVAPVTRTVLYLDRDDALGRTIASVDGKQIVTWQYGEQFAIPHWFPLKSPSGKDLLAQHPDPYPHHRAMWLADKVQLEDGPIVDFYHCFANQLDKTDAQKGYRHFIRQRSMPRCEIDGSRFFLTSELQWLVDGTQPVLDDERHMVIAALGDGQALIDLSWTWTANHGAVTFHSDWVHYGWPYLRMHPQFSVERGGVLVDDVGRRGQNGTNAQYANWMDYSNTVDGVTEGVAVFVPQDGTWRKWLTRDYGTFGPRRPDAQSGTKFTLAKGEAVSGSVRLYVHKGNAVTGKVAERYRDYVRQTQR